MAEKPLPTYADASIWMLLNTDISWAKNWQQSDPLPDVARMIAALYRQPESLIVRAARDPAPH